MNIKYAIITAVLSFSAAGCSTAGPFVTTLSSDGDDGLIVEKCMIKYNPWSGSISNEDCTNTAIKLRAARHAASNN